MFFSIICPSYNVDNYISQCIESIMKQSFIDWEMIIVDDESTDNTREIVSHFLKDDRISLFSIAHSGQTLAREYGIQKSKGKYIVFLDSDDCLHKDTLLLLFNNIKKHPYDILSYKMKYFDSIEELPSDNIIATKITTYKDDQLLKYYYGKNKTMSLCGNAIKKTLVVEGFNNVPLSLKTIRICEDFVTIFEIIRLCSSSMVFDKTLYFYRRNPQSVSHTKMSKDRLELTEAYEYVYKNYLSIEKNDVSIIDSTKIFLAYLPVTLVLNDSEHKYRTFIKSRKMFLFKTFSINNNWKSKLLKIMVFGMRYRIFILYFVCDYIYSKRYLKND